MQSARTSASGITYSTTGLATRMQHAGRKPNGNNASIRSIYPRHLVAEPVAGPPGLTFRGFRNDSPYQSEDLVFESNAPEHFLARCSRNGVTNSSVLTGAAHRQCRHRVALSARLADRLAKRRERYRSPDRAIASRLTDPLLGMALNSPDPRQEWEVQEYRTGGLSRFPGTTLR